MIFFALRNFVCLILHYVTNLYIYCNNGDWIRRYFNCVEKSLSFYMVTQIANEYHRILWPT